MLAFDFSTSLKFARNAAGNFVRSSLLQPFVMVDENADCPGLDLSVSILKPANFENSSKLLCSKPLLASQ